MSFSVARGGDWIDSGAARAVGGTSARMCSIKESGLDLQNPKTREEEAIVFRSLHAQLDDMTVVDELIYETEYTLTMLDAEYDLPTPSLIHFWSLGENPGALLTKLSDKTGFKVQHHDLNTLPPLSEGMLQRTMRDGSRIELIPREWVEHQARQKLNKRFSIIAGGIATLWIAILLIFLSVFKVRDMQLDSVKADANAIAPAARQAQENQKKLKALKEYTDRSDSSLECLREVSRLLPAGDIDFIKYNYSKEKGVSSGGVGKRGRRNSISFKSNSQRSARSFVALMARGKDSNSLTISEAGRRWCSALGCSKVPAVFRVLR